MRRDIAFPADGVTLRGWFYAPQSASGPAPTIVMAHGFSAVKEMCLQDFAEFFQAAGFAVLVFDFRNLGASDGWPRQEIDPWAQVRDFRHAVTFAQTLPEADPQRIGVWGSSFSGAHAMVAAAIDRRIKCVVGQVPSMAGGWRRAQRLSEDSKTADWRAWCDADRLGRFRGAPPQTRPVVTLDPAQFAFSPSGSAYKWFTETAAARAPAWRNEITLRTLEMQTEYDAAPFAERIAPTPLLMLLAKEEPTLAAQQAVFVAAGAPKKCVMLEGGHFDPYQGEGFKAAAAAAADWFKAHLAH